jgi:hypothetical protein
MKTIAESEAESAMHQMLSNFGYGITPRTVAAFLRVLAEYTADAKPESDEE